jgi:hypothetical protein
MQKVQANPGQVVPASFQNLEASGPSPYGPRCPAAAATARRESLPLRSDNHPRMVKELPVQIVHYAATYPTPKQAHVDWGVASSLLERDRPLAGMGSPYDKSSASSTISESSRRRSSSRPVCGDVLAGTCAGKTDNGKTSATWLCG